MRRVVNAGCELPALVSSSAANGGIDAQDRRIIAVFRGSKYWLFDSLPRFEDLIYADFVLGGKEESGAEKWPPSYWELRWRGGVSGWVAFPWEASFRACVWSCA